MDWLMVGTVAWILVLIASIIGLTLMLSVSPIRVLQRIIAGFALADVFVPGLFIILPTVVSKLRHAA
jgi:hypothetical protein